MIQHPNTKAVLVVGVFFLGAVLCFVSVFYLLAMAFNGLGLLWRLAVEDRDAWTLAGLIMVILAVCGLASRRRRT